MFFKNVLIVYSLVSCYCKTFEFEYLDAMGKLPKNYGIDDLCENSDTYENEGGSRFLSYIPHFEYYVKLSTNVGRNDTGSTCGYVAIGMLLTYYDSILNKNIVSDAYGVKGDDTVSFGCVYDSYFNGSLYYYPVAAYYNFLRERLSTSLHAKLILMHKGAETSNPLFIESTYKDEFGTTLTDLSDISSEYLTEIGLNNSASLVSYTSYYNNISNTDVFDFIDSEIDNNRPVIISYDGHWYLAYGYDTLKYKVHRGYINQPIIEITKFFLSQENFIDAFSIRFNLTHSFHAINYEYTDQNNNLVQRCLCGYNHPVNHSYNFSYTYLNNNYHKSYCGCGNYITELHTYRININNNPCPCGGSLWD